MSDAYVRRVAEALYSLLDQLDHFAEYPDAEWRAAQRYNVDPQDLRDAYDEYTGTTHNPEEYL